MSHDLETSAAASAEGFVRHAGRGHTPPAGAVCANCATELQGPWCHACGQSAEDFHRSFLRLIAEVVEGVLHMDGRLWRTLPDLMVRPGRLTRAYLEGHRAPQIPPLRLFLVVLLAVFLGGGLASEGRRERFVIAGPSGVRVASLNSVKSLADLTPQERAEVAGDRKIAGEAKWLQDRLNRTLQDPKRFALILEQWSERFAFLMLPVATLLLSVLFAFNRRFYLFDHAIFSLHSLSAVGLTLLASIAVSPVLGGRAFLLLLAAPVHLFAHMRGVYRTSVAGTLVRMLLLFVGSAIAAVLLLLGLVAVGLSGMAD